jgi:hypothetical protein
VIAAALAVLSAKAVRRRAGLACVKSQSGADSDADDASGEAAG